MPHPRPFLPRTYRTFGSGILGALGAVCFALPPAFAVTGVDLSGRMVIDGFTDEWEPDESLFQTNPETGGQEERISDSRWGFNNDLNQIRISWDTNFLYVAVNAIIWDNNVVILFDYDQRPGRGMERMTELNSWRRNFEFQEITPDMFLATWDGNTIPQVWGSEGASQVAQLTPDSLETVATFSQGNQGRAMEAAIPWSFVLGEDAVRVFSAAANDSVYVLPSYLDTLRVVGVVTAGPDGTGGPDSAPDNVTGHQEDSAVRVIVDNWATIPLDLDGDDVLDFGANIRDRTGFRIRPPIRGIRLELAGVKLNSRVISPENQGQLDFSFGFSPKVDPSEGFRTVTMSAQVFDMNGDKVRTLYSDQVRSAADPAVPSLDCWDGRDDDGRMVAGGVYILRLVIEPDANRITKAFTVVR